MMQNADEILCFFCKTSSSKSVTHSLCDDCLLHSKCYDEAEEEVAPDLCDADAIRQVECDICLEKYHEDELQHHRGMCMPRLVFRCSLCNEDYQSEESLWNHLTVHRVGVTDEDKELYYQEKRVTYKQHECILCNDQRSYKESCFWEHVHEHHDGFYLRCSECGESFRSQKRKADHGLNHCKFREPILPIESGLEMNEDYTNIDKQNDGLEEDFEPNQNEQQSILEFKEEIEIHDDEFPSDAGNDEGEREDGVTVPEQRRAWTLKTDCPICQDKFSDQNEVSQHVENMHKQSMCTICREIFPNVEKPNDHKCLTCAYCGRPCYSAKRLEEHIKQRHDMVKCNICGVTCSGRQNLLYHKKIVHTKPTWECSVCSKKFHLKTHYTRHHRFCSSRHVRYPCQICGRKLKSLNFVIAHMKNDHGVDEKPGQEEERLEKMETNAELNEAPQGESKSPTPQEESENDANDVDVKGNYLPCKLCGRKFKLLLYLKRHMDRVHFVNTEDKSAGVKKCPQCNKTVRFGTVAHHIDTFHTKRSCTICGIDCETKSQLRYHTIVCHTKPTFKCQYCPKKFHNKSGCTRHEAGHKKDNTI